MSDDDVRRTVARIDFRRESDRERLLAAALAGDQGARLVVYGAMRRQMADDGIIRRRRTRRQEGAR